LRQLSEEKWLAVESLPLWLRWSSVDAMVVLKVIVVSS
jgi:hypothetical protein